ncbi:alanine/ornithine racemase family PLP-dependent enzyme [Waterburya agarophytonicola K14]|uniref:Alanine/ornithine racemase family PLP-dependent enzyme n=1 Tax=Waterburya agarophytonicola KI4 TaxID=2874699 RepID=A0A964BNL6_9CYAN|nr:alanine/ornithine racemase family PLP-dependent enzyme [Waterburya agarophytonicola]MCC0175457.1 alanine/ornithine racemase family PLP-dependent enzyme [Waterburya agarophytonicola KI4]
MKAFMPRIEIILSQIQHNTRMLCELYGQQGISLMGVSKAVLGEPLIASAMIRGGVKFMADSRLENIQRMKNAKIAAQFVLLRTTPSQAESTVEDVDISLNTEIETLEKLNYYASVQNKIHQVILMVEMGDLREGILPDDLFLFVQKVLSLPHLKIMGLGCNLACYGGIKPDNQKMWQLSELSEAIEQKFQIDLSIISGGNSANHQWYKSAKNVGRINNLRVGESILLGCETLTRQAIPQLHTSAFKLIAEVIESKIKPSLPFGEVCQDAFGNMPVFRDRGMHPRAIIALGKQDTLISGLSLDQDLEILGSSSDHLVLESKNPDLKVGMGVNFNLDYGSLLTAMTSPFVQKQFIH